jgi:hypothetical protein
VSTACQWRQRRVNGAHGAHGTGLVCPKIKYARNMDLCW